MNRLKHCAIAVILTLVVLNCFSQTNKTDIENKFREYVGTLADKDFKKSVNYIPEEFFKFVPKEQLIRELEATFNNPEIAFKLDPPTMIEIENPKNINGKFYSMFRYESIIFMKFIKDSSLESDSSRNILKLALQNSFGIANVVFEEKTNWFKINTKKSAFAISMDGKGDWKFIVFEAKQRLILDKILPKEITDKL